MMDEIWVSISRMNVIHFTLRCRWCGQNLQGLAFEERCPKYSRAISDTLDGRFLSKLASIGDKLNETETDLGAVILIGVNRTEPLTALDGNHRLVAAMLTTPPRLEKLRFICGLSPQMMDCCWYNTNLVTLFSYGRNVLKNTLRNPEAELARLLRSVG